MNPLHNALRTYWLALLFMALNFALLAGLYSKLPDPVPLLWSVDGTVIWRMLKPMGAVLLPLLHLVVVGFLIMAPAVDPGALRAPEARRFYPPIVAMISGFLVFVTSLVFAASLGSPLSLPHAMLGGFGVLLALVGNYLGKIPKNYVVGIRTPWTLSSVYVWERTHRFAAPVFVVGGVALFLHSALQRESLNTYFVVSTLVVVILAPYFYSYVVWKRTGAASGHGAL